MSREMRRRVTRNERAEIVRPYELGLAAGVLAEQVEVSKGCVPKSLKAEGVTMRPRGNPGSCTAIANGKTVRNGKREYRTPKQVQIVVMTGRVLDSPSG
jgi:hypothetical protein